MPPAKYVISFLFPLFFFSFRDLQVDLKKSSKFPGNVESKERLKFELLHKDFLLEGLLRRSSSRPSASAYLVSGSVHVLRFQTFELLSNTSSLTRQVNYIINFDTYYGGVDASLLVSHSANKIFTVGVLSPHERKNDKTRHFLFRSPTALTAITIFLFFCVVPRRCSRRGLKAGG